MDDFEYGTEELDKKLIPIIFFNPLYKRESIVPHWKYIESWKKFQQTGRYKFKKYNGYFMSSPPKYLYEIKDDHIIKYVREEDGIKEYKLDDLYLFGLFGDYPPTDQTNIDHLTMDKEEFMKLGGLKIEKPPKGKKTPRRNRKKFSY